MSLTYAIVVLHGRFDLLTAAFDAIVKHAAERSIKIITLGDYVDARIVAPGGRLR